MQEKLVKIYRLHRAEEDTIRIYSNYSIYSSLFPSPLNFVAVRFV